MGTFATQHRNRIWNAQKRPLAAFTLIEMLAVMGIIATMLGMVLPAINDALGSKGRKGAVNILLNTFEQARVAALEQSTNVYVGFADKNIAGNTDIKSPTYGFAYTRFIIFRDYNADLDPAPAAGSATPKFVMLSKWQKLPNGVSFKSSASANSDIVNGETIPVDNFPSVNSTYNIPVLKFNSTGSIQSPSQNLRLFIYEGFFGGASDVFTRARGQGQETSLYERISFARFTGRAQLDITTTKVPAT